MILFFVPLYANRLTAATLPIEVGIPVKGMSLIKTAAIEWQAWIYMDVLHKRETWSNRIIKSLSTSFSKKTSLWFD